VPEIRFTTAAREHRIGRASARHVMATVIPVRVVTAQGKPSPRGFGRAAAMPRKQPPPITPETPIGPDVDLEHEDIRLADGTRLTAEVAESVAGDARRAAGRPSLTGPGRHSPQVSARVPAELRHAAEQRARQEGKSLSQVIRELLEKYVAGRLSTRH
jgi:hypothetical protein